MLIKKQKFIKNTKMIHALFIDTKLSWHITYQHQAAFTS
jgi:hypothetical protein